MSEIDQIVFQMHTDNGLWLDTFDSKLTVPEVEKMVIAILSQRFAPGEQHLCGNGVHFDRRMLEEHMPRLHDWFHYRNFDISSLLQGQQYGTQISGHTEHHYVPPKPTDHRGMTDVDWNIRAYGTWLSNHNYYPALQAENPGKTYL